MPWTSADAGSHTKKANTPEKKQRWASVANSVLESCLKSGGNQKECEAKAIRVANSKMELPTMSDFSWEEHNEVFGVGSKKDKSKPGGSNAGDYNKSDGPFCGPSGGAPKGTFPVGTLKRAKAALAYAHNAPNPEGIKQCVYRHWPQLKPKSKEKHMEKLNLPKSALYFQDDALVECQFSEQETTPKLKMIAYSGGMIKEHFYWGNLVIDIDGIKMSQKRIPVLREHDTSKPIAFTEDVVGRSFDGALQLVVDPEKTTFVDTEHSAEFIKLSRQGFPFQSSIYGKPQSITRFEKPTSIELNGRKFKNVNTVWNKCELKEVSVCVFGYDSKTQSSAFSETEEIEIETQEQTLTTESEVIDMTLDEFKEKYADLYNQIVELTEKATREAAEAKFADEKKTLEAQFAKEKAASEAKLQAQIDMLKETNVKRDVREFWDSALGDSKIPEHLWEKVEAMVQMKDFVKDGVFDFESFKKAALAEVKDWEDKGITFSVQGTGFSNRTSTGDVKTEEQLQAEDKAAIDTLLGYVKTK